MAQLVEAIALDISRKYQAGIPARQIAREILEMPEIAEALQLRDEHLHKAGSRGLHVKGMKE